MPVSQAISSPRLLPSNLNELITTPNLFRNRAHIDDDEIPLNRLGQSHMPKNRSGCRVREDADRDARQVTETDLHAVREAGFSEANIVEIAAFAAQFMLTNFVNAWSEA
ncbi:carboxymuconolactone decarboxylase family protein [Paraburkholderia phytofirmans]|uniref:Peroxidase n=1 Tax=Paraburkholderia phytofirmans TaxID=261302 RepID=A0ABW9BHR4_9BURK